LIAEKVSAPRVPLSNALYSHVAALPPRASLSSHQAPNGDAAQPPKPAVPTQPSQPRQLSQVTDSTRRTDLTEENRDFTEVKSKRRRPLKVVRENGTGGILNAVPEPSRDIFVYRLDRSTRTEDIKEHLHSLSVKPTIIEKMTRSQEARFVSFHIQVNKSDLPIVMDPKSWRQNVCVRRFIRERKPTVTTLWLSLQLKLLMTLRHA
jgi:hypothetical protein